MSLIWDQAPAPKGGEIIAQGSPQEVMAHPKSLTGAYLSGRLAIAVPSKRRAPDGRWLRICGARGHNYGLTRSTYQSAASSVSPVYLGVVSLP